MPTRYFTKKQVLDYHSGCGHIKVDDNEGYQTNQDVYGDGLFVYSFALKPEEHQPSGTCNFSRIDNAELSLETNETTFPKTDMKWTIYAVNYNVLRIMSGMGGLAYSN